jgi:hypothetical protein
MKKILSLMLLLFAAMMTTATFTACGDDDDDNPTTETPAQKAAGTYSGTDKVTIGGQWTYESSADYTVTANTDGSINLTVGEEKYANTVIGDITQGTFTIKNIPYDAATLSFTKNYAADKIYAHVKSPMMDNDYLLSSETETITVTPQADGSIKVVNSQYTYGTRMPFKIDAEFTGTRK